MSTNIERKNRFEDQKLEMELSSIVDQCNEMLKSRDDKINKLELQIEQLKKIINENIKV